MKDLRQLTQAMTEAWSRGDLAGADALARTLLQQNSRDPNALQILAALASQRGQAGEALAHLRIADAAAPNHPPILNMMGVALRDTSDMIGARAVFARAGALGLAEAWRNLGDLETGAGNAALALECFEKAVAAQPGYAPAQASLAAALERGHDLARAKVHAEAALRADPRSQTARLVLGQVAVRENDNEAARTALAPLRADRGASVVNRVIATGLIGEILDQEARYDEAFAAFSDANAELASINADALNDVRSPFHPESVARLTRFMTAVEANAWRNPQEFEQAAPVFLVGFPRSGTTLLDQILASHSQIACLEESEALAASFADLLAPEALPLWRSLSHEEIAERRRRYCAAAHAQLGAPLGSRIFVDKLPLNIVLLPLIARFFPDARIILALRDPRDVILSCYQQRFGMNAAMAQLLNIDSAARYYDAVMTLGLKSLEAAQMLALRVRYEDLVADLHGVARALARFLGVAFEPRMLEFDRTARERLIRTPSARQVVQPLYARSVGRWRNYARHLDPALPVLAPWVARFGYPAAAG